MGARTRGIANNILTSGTVDATDGLSAQFLHQISQTLQLLT